MGRGAWFTRGLPILTIWGFFLVSILTLFARNVASSFVLHLPISCSLSCIPIMPLFAPHVDKPLINEASTQSLTLSEARWPPLFPLTASVFVYWFLVLNSVRGLRIKRRYLVLVMCSQAAFRLAETWEWAVFGNLWFVCGAAVNLVTVESCLNGCSFEEWLWDLFLQTPCGSPAEAAPCSWWSLLHDSLSFF